MSDLSIEYSLRDEDDPETVRRSRLAIESVEALTGFLFPVLSDLRGDDEGNLWIRKFVPEYEEGPSEWWVFSSDGEYRADASLPRGVSLRHIGSDFMLGVTIDELGVERVVRYALAKR